jgi:hypothetical protein
MTVALLETCPLALLELYSELYFSSGRFCTYDGSLHGRVRVANVGFNAVAGELLLPLQALNGE